MKTTNTTKLKIDFHADLLQDTLIESFAVMVAKHNSGKANLNLDELQGYFKAHCARHGIQAESFLDESTLSLQIRGKAFVTIELLEMIGEISADEKGFMKDSSFFDKWSEAIKQINLEKPIE